MPRAVVVAASPSAESLRKDVPSPVGPYSPAYRAGGLLFCSGQLGIRDGELLQGFVAQAAQALINLQELLVESGARLSDVVKTTVFLTNMDDYDEMNREYSSVFGEHRPARSAVAVSALPKGALFEIDAIALMA